MDSAPLVRRREGSGSFLALFSCFLFSEAPYDSHKFAIGQIVDFDTKVTPMPRPRVPTRCRAAAGGRRQVAGVSHQEQGRPFERSAKEYEIVAVQSAASELAETFGGAAGADRTR